MDEYLNYELELRQKAWKLHFKEKKKTKTLTFRKTNKKYKINWVKKKDENDLFEKWVPIKTPNEKYVPEQESKEEQLVPNVNEENCRRSSRIITQNFWNEQKICNKKYVDPSSSDFSFSESETDK